MSTSLVESYVVVEATAAQQAASITRHAPYWGDSLSADEYKERERILSERPLTRDGAMQYRVLVPTDDLQTLDFIASCETFRRTVLFNAGNGIVQRLPAYSIASVWVNKEQRSRGYAKQLMSQLHDHLRRERPHPACSFLFSDIGDYYSRCLSPAGVSWQAHSTRELHAPLEALPADLADSVQLLDETEILPLIAQDGALLEAEVKRAHRPTVVVELTGLEVDWLIARTHFYAASPSIPLPPPGAPPAVFGARLTAASTTLAYAVWSFDLPKKRVLFLRLRCTTPDELVHLLAAARRAGEAQGCDSVLMWNPPERLLVDEVRGYVRDMEDSWPCLAWYLEGGDAPVWLAQEKYAWC